MLTPPTPIILILFFRFLKNKLISSFDLFSIGAPESPPFSSLFIFLRLSLFFSEVFDIIKISIECLTNESQISSIELKFISGEIFTAIGKLDCNSFFLFEFQIINYSFPLDYENFLNFLY